MKGRPSTKQSRLTARRKRRQLNAVVDRILAASGASSDQSSDAPTTIAELLDQVNAAWRRNPNPLR